MGISGAILGAAGIGAVGSAVSSGQQAGAAQNATDAQVGMFNQVMGNLQPYMKAGKGALGQLQGYLNPNETGGPGGTPGLLHSFGTADLNANLAPNYGFGLSQGLGQVQNEAAAAGGALGGNALTGMNTFAQNYAQNAYQQAFQNYQTNQNNIYGRLGSLAQLGQASSTGQASGAPLFSQGISQTLQELGAANAAGTVGMSNAITGGLNNLSGYYMMNQFMNPGSQGGFDFGYLPPNPTSDRRLKKDILALGKHRNGLTAYEFRYVWEGSGKKHLGYMADEVRDIFPDAVLVDDSGYLMVDYGRIGECHA